MEVRSDTIAGASGSSGTDKYYAGPRPTGPIGAGTSDSQARFYMCQAESKIEQNSASSHAGCDIGSKARLIGLARAADP